jgi:hypothetical protein
LSDTKTVRLDKELMDSLADKREGFETPNDCLKRLLNGKCANSNKVTKVEEDE